METFFPFYGSYLTSYSSLSSPSFFFFLVLNDSASLVGINEEYYGDESFGTQKEIAERRIFTFSTTIVYLSSRLLMLIFFLFVQTLTLIFSNAITLNLYVSLCPIDYATFMHSRYAYVARKRSLFVFLFYFACNLTQKLLEY